MSGFTPLRVCVQNAAHQTRGNSNVTLCTKLAVASCLVARRQRQCMQISSSSLPSELSPVSKQQLAQLDANQNDGRRCSWQGDSLSLDGIYTYFTTYCPENIDIHVMSPMCYHWRFSSHRLHQRLLRMCSNLFL